MMKIFVSGSCRLVTTINNGYDKVIPIHSMFHNYAGVNFLGKLHNTKQHIQFIKFIKDEITIPNNILSCGDYKIRLTLASPYTNTWTFDDPGEVVKFKIIDTISDRGARRNAVTSQFLKWELLKHN